MISLHWWCHYIDYFIDIFFDYAIIIAITCVSLIFRCRFLRYQCHFHIAILISFRLPFSSHRQIFHMAIFIAFFLSCHFAFFWCRHAVLLLMSILHLLLYFHWFDIADAAIYHYYYAMILIRYYAIIFHFIFAIYFLHSCLMPLLSAQIDCFFHTIFTFIDYYVITHYAFAIFFLRLFLHFLHIFLFLWYIYCRHILMLMLMMPYHYSLFLFADDAFICLIDAAADYWCRLITFICHWLFDTFWY